MDCKEEQENLKESQESNKTSFLCIDCETGLAFRAD